MDGRNMWNEITRISLAVIIMMLSVLAIVPMVRADIIASEEFLVNTNTLDDQLRPCVATDQDGDFVITWATGNDVRPSKWLPVAQRFDANCNKVGNELQVSNNYVYYPIANPTVAMHPNGDFIVTWGRGWGGNIMAQMFYADGSKHGGEIIVNGSAGSIRAYPRAAIDKNTGDFIVAWTSYGGDGSLWSVHARRFDVHGNKLGGEIRVNTYTHMRQHVPDVAIDQDGGFAITWHSQWQDGDMGDPGGAYGVNGIYAKRYDASGDELPTPDPSGNGMGNEFQVNTYTSGDQSYPQMGMDANGNFVITWRSYDQDGDGWGVYAQRFDAGGNRIGGEFQVNTYTTGHQNGASVAIDPRGGFIVTWNSYGQDGSDYGIYARKFTVDTTPPEISVSVDPDELWPPNHRMKTITATVTATDNCDPSPSIALTSIVSDELDDGLGDGDTPVDIQDAEIGEEDDVFSLRAERSGVGDGRVYTIAYTATDASGNSSSAEATVTVPHDKGKKGQKKLVVPGDYALFQNVPNPFNPETTIEYVLPKRSYVRLAVYNMLGQEVARLVDREQMAGYHTVVWDASGISGGVYLCRMEVGEFCAVRKVLLMK